MQKEEHVHLLMKLHLKKTQHVNFASKALRFNIAHFRFPRLLFPSRKLKVNT